MTSRPSAEPIAEPRTPLEWSAELARAIAAERRRLRTFVEAHRLNVENVESALVRQLEELLGQSPLTKSPSKSSPAAPAVTEQTVVEQASRALSSPPAAHEAHRGVTPAAKRSTAKRDDAIAWREKVGADAVEPLDWESQKHRILAALEAESVKDAAQEGVDEGRVDERMTIDGTIRITDSVIAEKDREIDELKKLLQDQSRSVGNVAIGAAALEAIFNTDEIIVAERERLEQTQVELNRKLRVAEIELSQERASIARERVELDEKRLQVDEQRAQLEKQRALDAAAADFDDDEPKVHRSRWLSRLGLKDRNGERF